MKSKDEGREIADDEGIAEVLVARVNWGAPWIATLTVGQRGCKPIK